MEGNPESSQHPKAENVKINIDDQVQSMKKKFSQYNVKDQKPVVTSNYRVPNNIRKGHEDAYTPKVVSIGPIHHGKPKLQTMERSKWMFLGWYMERTLVSFDDMVRVGIDIEKEARMSYVEEFDNISNREFSEMIILDFIFLIEFFFKVANCDEKSIPLEDFIFIDIVGDTILLENQFPNNLVTNLFRMLYYKENNLGNLILNYLRRIGHVRSLSASPDDWSSATNMLDFLVMCHDGKMEDPIRSEIQGTWLKRARSATELREAGVQFSKVVDKAFLLDVKFVNGVLIMPVIEIDIFFGTCFRNMMAFEQSRRDKPKRVSGYLYLLSNLIRSPKDVVLLSNCGIIEHPHHNVEQVIHLFQDVGKGAAIDIAKCYFWGIYMEMHAYSRNYWHQWKGSWFKWKRVLREDYFSNPWTIISVIAAFILLVLTVIQTACSIIQL